MKLLFDQNLPSRLVSDLSDVFPSSQHVRLVGLDRAADSEIWTYARDNGFVIVSKDSTSETWPCGLGHHPKLCTSTVGNATTCELLTVILAHVVDISEFDEDENSLLVLTRIKS